MADSSLGKAADRDRRLDKAEAAGRIDDAEMAALRAEHGEVVKLSADGLQFVARMPTLVELTKARSGRLRETKRVVKACLVWPETEARARLLLKKAGLYVALGPALIRASGHDSGALEVLDEDEIEDAAMAAAYEAETSKKAFAGKVHALAYSRRSVRHALLCRDLRGPEVDALEGASVDAIRNLVVKVTLWGDAAAIERDAPGLYLTIIDYLASEAGMLAEVEEGE